MRLKSSRWYVSFLLASACLLCDSAAQTRRPAPKPAAPKPAAKSCDGAWSGTVIYSKMQNKTEREERPTGYIGGKSAFEASAEVILAVDGSARASVSVRATNVVEDVKEGVDCCSITMAGCSRKGAFKEVEALGTESEAEAAAAAVVNGVTVSGDTFTIDISLPAATGKTVRTIRKISKRECDGVDRDDSHEQRSDASYALGPVRVSGTIDPRNPNVIRGTQTEGDVTITYNLVRCAR